MFCGGSAAQWRVRPDGGNNSQPRVQRSHIGNLTYGLDFQLRTVEFFMSAVDPCMVAKVIRSRMITGFE